MIDHGGAGDDKYGIKNGEVKIADPSRSAAPGANGAA
jgi:hypothetical protein